jgi:glutamate-ammonia-ligase adenylyltransferase
MIYEADGVEASVGPKSLASRSYYARLTQALVTAITAPMAEGRLYEIDMRLRPSGNQGPVATSLTSFESYQRDDAWVWEHLALTRARVVTGAPEVAQDVEDLRVQILSTSRDKKQILSDVQEMRARINAAKASPSPWDAKIGTGRMQDIELFAQACVLIKGGVIRQTARAIRASDILTTSEKRALTDAYSLVFALQIGSKLVSDTALNPERLGADGCRFLARLTGMSDMSMLMSELEARTEHAAQIIEATMQTAEAIK